MQQREKILATALAATAGLFVLRPVFDSLFLQPLRERNATLETTKATVSGLEDKDYQLLSSMRSLNHYREESLPPNPFDAQREYSKWLTRLALLCNWRNPREVLGSRTPRGPATMVPITIKAQATLEDVNRLLQRLESAALLQRVVELNLTSPSSDGNPLLDVELIAEGVAIQDAAPRTRLFPTAELAAAVDATVALLVVKNPTGFPKAAPFVVRLDNELVDVTSIAGDQWTVVRAAQGTTAVPQPADTPIELLPLRSPPADLAGRALPSVQRIFVRTPDSGGPRLTAELTPAIRGRDWKVTLKAANWDAAQGTPRYELASTPPTGMTLNPQSGVLEWMPPEEFALGPLDLPIAVFGRDPQSPIIESALKVDVRRPNNAPQLELPETLSVWLGRPWTYTVPATDSDLPNDTLTYALDGNVPAGLTIDAASGRMSWTPDAGLDLGDFEVEVTVTDTGLPPATDQRTVTLKLVDDSAQYTYLSGTIASGGAREAWLYDRSTNKLTIVRAGQEFQIADVTGKVVRVDEDAMDVQSGEQVYHLKMGQNLRNWTPVSSESPAANGDASKGSGESSGT